MQCNRCGIVLPPGAPVCPRCANPTSYNVGGSAPNQYGPTPGPQYGPPPGPPPQYGPVPGPPPQYGPAPYPGPYVQPPMRPYMPPPKKGGGFVAGLGVGILLLVVCLCCGGAWWAQSNQERDKHAESTASADDYHATATAIQATSDTRLTPTPYSEISPPSNQRFSNRAQGIMTNAQLASKMYDDKQPELVTKTFNVSQSIYASFKLASGQSGYLATKWYINGRSGEWSDSVSVQGRVGYGYFSASYSGPGQGAVEYYWCPSSDCSDGELAWVRTFEVR